MELKWGMFAPCLNEGQLIEAKLEWALERFVDISIVEGHHPKYTNVNENGLSVDKTTEILSSYNDRIKHTPIGKVNNEMELRNIAYRELNKDLDVVIMCDIDEFYLDKDLERLDNLYKSNKDLKLTLTNSYIFLDGKHCAPHIRRIQSQPFPFSKDVVVHFGEWHERIFRYNKWYSYHRSPFLINDFFGRFLYNDEIYYNERMLIPDIHMLHYKNFKLGEAKKRTELYDTYGDGVKHDTEWATLEGTKIEYKGEHPKKISELFSSQK